MNYFPAILFICCGVAGAIIFKKLTVVAALAGGLLASIVFSATAWIGVLLMVSFFLLATVATSWKKNLKNGLGITQEKGSRNAAQVLANGGAAGLLALLSLFSPSHAPLFLIMIAGTFSSATADTVSSELGSVYGRKFYDVLSFRKGGRGADGVISLEGTLFGFLGSCIIAAVYCLSEGWDQTFIWIIIAGTAGNLSDSYLGATLERRGVVGNDAVNFLNTVIAALVILLLYIF